MRPLIIIAHPRKTRSHTRHAFSHARSLLERAQVEYDIIDLYDDTFDPVMREHPTPENLALLDRYRSLIDATDRILILYPVWWNGPPAILKGFFDCVLTPGWAYHYAMTPIPKVGRPIGHLTGKRAAIVSTSGALDILHLLVQHTRAGRVVGHDILGFVGIKARRFNVGGCQEYSEDNLRRVERTVERSLRYLRAV